MPLNKQLLFIIGSPRSGTTWLQMMLGAHPQVCTTVELTLFSKYTGPWIKTWQREKANLDRGQWHQGLPYIWHEEEFYEFLRAFLEKAYDRVASKNPTATHILDKHPGYSSYVNDITHFFPQARFIHMIRDGRDVALSMQAVEKQLGWFGIDTINGFAAHWRDLVESAQRAHQYTDFYMEVRYEELMADGINKLKEVFEFCNLNISDDQIKTIFDDHHFDKMKLQNRMPVPEVKAPAGHYGQGQVGIWQHKLTPLQKYLFDEEAGYLLYQLGYARPMWWANSRIKMFFLPLLAAGLTRKKFRLRIKNAFKHISNDGYSLHSALEIE